MKKNLLIIGAGQFGQVTKEIAESTKNYDKIDFLDDGSDLAIDKIVNAKNYKNEYQCFVVAMGNPEKRKIIVETLEKKFELVSIISPKAYISSSAIIGKGSIIESNALVNANTTIGKSCLICVGAIVNHNAIVNDYCHINCGAIVKSNSIVKENTKVDYGEIV